MAPAASMARSSGCPVQPRRQAAENNTSKRQAVDCSIPGRTAVDCSIRQRGKCARRVNCTRGIARRLYRPASSLRGLLLGPSSSVVLQAALLLSSWCLATSASSNVAPALRSWQERLTLSDKGTPGRIQYPWQGRDSLPYGVSSLSRAKEEAGRSTGNNRHLLTDASDSGLEIESAARAYDLAAAEARGEEGGAEAGESEGEEGAGQIEAGEEEKVSLQSGRGRGRNACNYSKGRWVREVGRQTAYTGHSCRTIRSHENCQFHGRNDTDYLDWRWEPSQPACTLKRFDALAFLDKNRNKIMAFAGDSLSVNFEDAVRCQLSSVAREKARKFRLGDTAVVGFKYPDYNFTVIHFASTFLVEAVPQRDRKDWKALWRVHVDRPGKQWARVVRFFDIFVFTAGPWFTQARPGQRKYFIDDEEQPTFDGPEALRHALKTVRRTIEGSGFAGVPVVLTASPTHYAGIKTSKRGNCEGRTTPLGRAEMKVVESDNPMSEVYRIQKAVFSPPTKPLYDSEEGVEGGRVLDFKFLDVTRLSMYRPDAHSQGFTGDPKKFDCIHWCLPGLPDTWVDILDAIL